MDIDWEDNAAMDAGTGENWIIEFTRRLRELLPDHIISHAPQAPYFSEDHYSGGSYMKVEREIGDLIDFYNVQFYNQGDTSYDTYEKLFISSGGYFPGTSVQEIIDRGVPREKIVVGKPAVAKAAYNTGYMTPEALGAAVSKANDELGWRTGVMFWQYRFDTDGAIIKEAIGNLLD